MTDEELQEEQRRDFEARRDLAFKQLVCALNEGDAEIFDIEVEKNKEGEDVAWIYFKGGEAEMEATQAAIKSYMTEAQG